MSITGIAAYNGLHNIQLPDTGEIRSAKDISARTAQELQMKVSVAVLKEIMDFEKKMAQSVVDRLL